MQLLILGEQVVLAFGPVRIGFDAVDRTDQLALRVVLGADAFGALHRIDYVHRVAGGDGLVWTYRFASVTRRTGIGNQQCHCSPPRSRRLWRFGKRGESLMAVRSPQRGPDRPRIDRILVAADRDLHVLSL